MESLAPINARGSARWMPLLACLTLLALGATAVAQEQENAEDADRGTHKDQIVEINKEEMTITVTGGGEKHTHKITERTQFNIGNGEGGIDELKPGDMVYVTIDDQDRDAAAQIEVIDSAADGEVEGQPVEQLEQDQQPRVAIGVRATEAQGREGAFVLNVAPDGPAATAGIRPRDLIVAINEQPVSSPRELIDLLSQFKPEDRVEITVEHGEETRSVEVTLAAYEDVARASAREADDQQRAPDEGGSQERDPESRPFLGVMLDRAEGGLVVVDVMPESPAAQAGLRPGDVILSVGGQNVGSPRELGGMVQDVGVGQPLAFLVGRGDEQIEMNVTIGDQRQMPQMQGEEQQQFGDPRGGDFELEFGPGRGDRGGELEQLVIELRDEVTRLREEVESLKEQMRSTDRQQGED